MNDLHRREEGTPRQFTWLVAVLLVPFVLAVAARWGQPPSMADGDYAQYLLHARNLVEGRPYADIGYIHSSHNWIGPPAQPPGWPLVLAPVVGLFGVDSPAVRVLSVVLVAASAVAAGAFFARRSGPLIGAATGAITALSLEAQGATLTAYSEPLFVLLVWGILLLADERTAWSSWRSVGIAAMAAGAVATRVAGVALVPALLVYAFVRYPQDRRRTLTPLLVLSAVGVIVAMFATDIVPFLRTVFGVVPWILTRPEETINVYSEVLLVGTLYPLPGNRPNDLYHLVALLPMTVGLVPLWREHGKSPLLAVSIGYVVLLLLAPVRVSRYAWPLLPIVAFALVAGLQSLLSRGARRWSSPRPVALVTAGIVLLICAGATARLAAEPAPPSFQTDPSSREVFAFFAGLPAGTRVLFPNPRVLTLQTGVPAMGTPYGTSGEIVTELIEKGITHVAVPSNAKGPERGLVRAIGLYPMHFSILYRNAGYRVYRFVARSDASRSPSGP